MTSTTHRAHDGPGTSELPLLARLKHFVGTCAWAIFMSGWVFLLGFSWLGYLHVVVLEREVPEIVVVGGKYRVQVLEDAIFFGFGGSVWLMFVVFLRAYRESWERRSAVAD